MSSGSLIDEPARSQDPALGRLHDVVASIDHGLTLTRPTLICHGLLGPGRPRRSDRGSRSRALVGDLDELSRTPTLDRAVYDGILERLVAQGDDPAGLQTTLQPG